MGIEKEGKPVGKGGKLKLGGPVGAWRASTGGLPVAGCLG